MMYGNVRLPEHLLRVQHCKATCRSPGVALKSASKDCKNVVKKTNYYPAEILTMQHFQIHHKKHINACLQYRVAPKNLHISICLMLN